MDGDGPPAVGKPRPDTRAADSSAWLAAVADVLTGEDDPVKGIARAFGLLVPARFDLCEVYWPGVPGEAARPGPSAGFTDPATCDRLLAAVSEVLADGAPRLGIDVVGRAHAVPLRSGSALLGALGIVGEVGADEARVLAALVALRLDAAPLPDSPLRPEDGAVHEARLALRPRPQSASVARSVVRDVLTGAGLADVLDTALLLVSELVSNALRHGSGPYELLVTCDDDGVLVSVGDRSPSSPRPRRPVHDMLDEDGRGLLLVEALATDWGWTTDAGGKRVWFRLDRA